MSVASASASAPLVRAGRSSGASLSDGSSAPVWLLLAALLLAAFSLYTLHSYAALMRVDEQRSASARADSPVPSLTAARIRLTQLMQQQQQQQGGGGGGVEHAPTTTRPPLLPPSGLHHPHAVGEVERVAAGGAGGLQLRSGSSRQQLLAEMARKLRLLPRSGMETHPQFVQKEEERKRRHQQQQHNQQPVAAGGAPAVQGAGAISTVPAASASAAADPIPILLFTFNRAENLRSTLLSVLSHRPADTSLHPVFISQDGGDEATRRVAMEFVSNAAGDPRWRHVYYLNFRWDVHRVAIEPQHAQWTTYYKIATHYRWALGQLFDGMAAGGAETSPSLSGPVRFSHAILLEDDMHISPDFYSYFRRTRTLLDNDPTLMCVSAWNDNGRAPLAHDPRQLYRSDCFPGLGWMLSRRLWEELGPRWPKGFWDDWLREAPQRAGRSCLFPERNRVYTFGSVGASAGQFYEQFLRAIVLNEERVEWDTEKLDYVDSKEHYRAWMHGRIRGATRVTSAQQAASMAPGDFVVDYPSIPALDAILHGLNMMTDHKAGVPRTSFEGVLSAHLPQGQRLWIVPSQSPFLQPTL